MNTLTRCPITTYAQLNQLLEGALTARAVSAISTNTDTTQSHTFFQLVLTRTSVKQLQAELDFMKSSTADEMSAAERQQHNTDRMMKLTRSLLSQQELGAVFESVMSDVRELLGSKTYQFHNWNIVPHLLGRHDNLLDIDHKQLDLYLIVFFQEHNPNMLTI